MHKTWRQHLLEATLAPLPSQHSHPELNRFYTLLRDYPQRGGKQLRGLFVLLSCEAHGGAWQGALNVGAAVELFQNWVLIHDDIEDGSEERRGQPALHQQVGMPVALNVGDALHVYMWELLHDLPNDLPKADILHTFTSMIHRTAEGQHLDLAWVTQNRFDITEADYLGMVTLKSAYYTVTAPLSLGALCAGETPSEHVETAGKALGVAFQIRDDVLNLRPSEVYGKEFAGDLLEAKRTLILAHLFTAATADEVQELESRLSKARKDKTPEDVTRVLKLIEQYGSLDYAQSVAEAKANEGLALLREAFAPLTNQALAQELTGLLETLVSRSA